MYFVYGLFYHKKFVDLSDSLKVYATRLGKIQPGYEWLAFTFNTQKMHWTKEKFDAFLEFSESQLKDAYSRMDMPALPWTKGTKNEVDFILSQTGISPESKILDLGCGQGRHCLELAKRNFNEIIGIDFADQNVKRARESAKKENLNCTFISGDARSFSAGKDFKYDCILCLYDVIGSFRNEADNKRILRNIKQHLAPSKHAVISVMNMELTESLAKHKVSIKEHPEELLALSPSETMKSSGDIFSPDLYLIDSDENVVYRKEQFSDDGNILAEYVVADRRYTLKQITELVQSVGLKVREARYVRAGKWDEPLEATNLKAKEIVLVLEN